MTCFKCGAPVRWETTVAGKKVPLNIDESTSPNAGNFVLRDGKAAYVSDDVRRQLLTDGSEPVYVAHFATCKQKGN